MIAYRNQINYITIIDIPLSVLASLLLLLTPLRFPLLLRGVQKLVV
jgi:hypothetical protein